VRVVLPEREFNYCPNCGSKLVKSDKFKTNFCCKCGHKLKNQEQTSREDIQCTVCHESIWHRSTRVVKCSFCGSKYHYSCVHDWLVRHNACPMCQNVFLRPNLTLSRKRK
ncbi:MAG: RING finger domain-containing protein, partial [Promethearchaeota archaeon]